MNISRIKKVKLPTRGTSQSAGIDFYVPDEFDSTTLKPNESIRIASGIKCDIPKNHALIGFNKSGIALKGLSVGACVVDEDYQGEISLHVFNHSNKNIIINGGEKLVQFILLPVVYEVINEVDETNIYKEVTERGEGGFGSTGK